MNMIRSRAAEIALRIAGYRATKRKVEFDPSNINQWNELGDKWNVTPNEAQYFFTKVVLPNALAVSTGCRHGLDHFPNGNTERAQLGEIALSVVAADPIELSKNRTPKWLEGLAEQIKVPHEDLELFYTEYILPDIVAYILKWDRCTISGSRDERHGHILHPAARAGSKGVSG
jgi:hypothetical protein